MQLPIDTDRLVAIAAKEAEPVVTWAEMPDGRRRPTDTQDTDDEGTPLWSVEVMIVGERTALAQVRIASRTCPTVTPLSPVRFDRLTVSTRVKDGREVAYWNASGVAAPLRAAQAS